MAVKRLMLVASGGGHWVQLSRLSPAFEGHKTLYVTTMQGAEAPSGSRPVAIVKDASRSKPVMFAVLFTQMLWIVLKFRPHVIVTTGAAPGLVAIQVGKVLGARTVWIDSLANSERMSLSGSLARRHADLWLTQWPHLVDKYPNLSSFGAVL
jgi:Oligosaccharide biosynthesis protein Alg14 like